MSKNATGTLKIFKNNTPLEVSQRALRKRVPKESRKFVPPLNSLLSCGGGGRGGGGDARILLLG